MSKHKIKHSEMDEYLKKHNKWYDDLTDNDFLELYLFGEIKEWENRRCDSYKQEYNDNV